MSSMPVTVTSACGRAMAFFWSVADPLKCGDRPPTKVAVRRPHTSVQHVDMNTSTLVSGFRHSDLIQVPRGSCCNAGGAIRLLVRRHFWDDIGWCVCFDKIHHS